ncbi:MAG: shikimate dehydrogenase [bacterium]
MNINGKTKVVGIIGSPIEHTLSPRMHNAAFSKLGLDWLYVPFHVSSDGLSKAIMGMRAFGLRGLNVTVPHKESVMEFLDEFDADAKKIGAVNTIANKNNKLIGYNTDCYGFVTSSEKEGSFKAKGKKAVLIGAGGAAKAIAVGLAQQGVQKITIFDIVKFKAEILSEKIKKEFGCAVNYFEIGETTSLFWVIKEADILINATPVGMKPADKLVVPPGSLHQGLFVYDVIYKDTPLIKLAKKKKLKHVNGFGMLLYQAAKSLEIWTGKKAPVDVMKKQLIV